MDSSRWAQILVAVGAAWTLVSLVIGLTSYRTQLAPVLGRVMRILDRVSYLTHRDAPGTLQWPLIATSVTQAVLDELRGAPMPPRRPTLPPPSMLLLVLALALGAWLAGCPGMPPVDQCTPGAWRCAGGQPQLCSPGQRWTPADRPCAEVAPGAACCLTLSPSGRAVAACLPACPAPDGGVDDAR